MQLAQVTLPLRELIEASAAVLPHISKDDVMPVLTAALISGSHIIATDRYSVGRFGLSAEVDGGSIMLPGDAARWLAGFPVKSLLDIDREVLSSHRYWVTVTAPAASQTIGMHAEDAVKLREEIRRATVTVTVGNEGRPVEQQRMFRPVVGILPPVAKIIEDFEAAADAQTVALNPAFIERFTTYARKYKYQHIEVTLSKREGSDKPGVVRFTIGDNFVGLLQPKLITRHL